jgi:negative regulator of flagellin synthesis FlgM
MPPIEIGSALPVGAVDTRNARAANGGTRAEKPTSPQPAMVKSDALDPGQPPADVERVEMIRKAVEAGKYPILPAKVADAMIAAGLLLRTPK